MPDGERPLDVLVALEGEPRVDLVAGEVGEAERVHPVAGVGVERGNDRLADSARRRSRARGPAAGCARSAAAARSEVRTEPPGCRSRPPPRRPAGEGARKSRAGLVDGDRRGHGSRPLGSGGRDGLRAPGGAAACGDGRAAGAAGERRAAGRAWRSSTTGRSTLAWRQTFTKRCTAVTQGEGEHDPQHADEQRVEQQAEPEQDDPLGPLHDPAPGVEARAPRPWPAGRRSAARRRARPSGSSGDAPRVGAGEVPGHAAEQQRVGDPVGHRVEERPAWPAVPEALATAPSRGRAAR